MKKFFLKVRRYIPRMSVIRSLIFVLGFGYVGFAYASLFPGPLTGHRVDQDPIGGYVSHAQFERGCTHCHEPLHCIGEDRCQGCHVEIAQQKAEVSGLHGLLPGTNRCQNCHVEHQGRQADITVLAFKRIDHASLADFSLDYHQLDYAGQPMNCQSCHSQDEYRIESLDCITCHAANDHDLVAAHIEEHGSECRSCHDGVTRLAEFEHNVQAFNLTGAHTELECKECHSDPDLQYKGIPTDCVNCHTEEERPDSHPQFGNDCARCHDTVAFAPARLTRHTFELQHAGIEALDCQTCHNISYDAVNCLGCHTEGGRVEAIHRVGLGIVVLSDCASCHPTGSPADLLLDDNFPVKGSRPPEDGSASGEQQAEPESPASPTVQPTGSSKSTDQTPSKEQQGSSTQP